MDTTKWKSVAIRVEIVELAKEIGERTERPTSSVFAYAVKRLHKDFEKERKWHPSSLIFNFLDFRVVIVK